LKEEQRAQLAQRAQTLSVQEEEDLGWDDLDPDGDDAAAAKEKEPGVEAAAEEPPALATSDEAPVAEALAEEDVQSGDVVERQVGGSAMQQEEEAAADVMLAEGPPGSPLQKPLSEPATSQDMSEAQPQAVEKQELPEPGEHLPVLATSSEPDASDAASAGTASDSPGKDWCVVSSPSKQASDKAAAQAAALTPEADDSAPAAGKDASVTDAASAKSVPTAPSGGPKPARPNGAAGEEDLDWGNWD
jgi:hypothetical protein